VERPQPTVFDPEGSVTPGNASSINDAAAALVLADGEYSKKRGLKPIGRLVGYAYAGVDPRNSKEVRAMVEKVAQEFTHLDILANNAGITRDSLLPRMTDEQWVPFG
jgi:acetyl-CoA C-acetyltransferase